MNAEQINKLPIIGMDANALVGKSLVAVDASIKIQVNLLLKEIAYQLAVMNENRFKAVFTREADGELR